MMTIADTATDIAETAGDDRWNGPNHEHRSARLASRRDESGVSIHLVDAEYETGAVVRQCTVPVLTSDSVDDLKARVRARERELVVETLGQIASGEIRLLT